MEEIWKDIEGFEGLYQISSYGRLKHFSKRFGWHILKNTNKKGWYLNVVLKSKEKIKSSKVHRLVAEAFIPNPQNKKCVNHIDGNKQNNKVDNLEWVTHKENIRHAIDNGLMVYNKPYLFTRHYIDAHEKGCVKPKKVNNNSKKYISIPKEIEVCQFSLNGDYIATFSSCADASRQTGVCQRNIVQVAYKEEYNKKKHLVRKQAGGYIWKLKKEVMI